MCKQEVITKEITEAEKQSLNKLKLEYENIGFVFNKINPQKLCGLKSCGNKLQRANAKFCSKKCSTEYHTMYKTKNCKHCGNTFKPHSIISKFCSRACYLSFTVKPEKTCKNPDCGNPIIKNQNNSTFCSLTCFYKFRRNGEEILEVCQCSDCQKPLSQYQKYKKRKFCSHNCYIKNKLVVNGVGNIILKNRKRWKTPRRFIKTESGFILLSNYTWNNNNGKIPERCYIGFKDEDSFNDGDINNLYLKKY